MPNACCVILMDGGAGVPPDEYEERHNDMKEWFGDEATDWRREGAMVRYTWDSGPKISTMTLGEFAYPGIGGPDITLDFVMGEHDGKPESVGVLFEMPPGIPGPEIGVHV